MGEGVLSLSLEGLLIKPGSEDGQVVGVLGPPFLLERAVRVAVRISGHHDRKLQLDLLLQVAGFDDELRKRE